MYKRLLLLIILVFLFIVYDCAKPTSPMLREVQWNKICARRYQAEMLELENSPAPEDEEYEVYVAVLEAEFLTSSIERIVIQNGIVEDGSERLLESMIHVAGDLTVTEDLLDDFRIKNQGTYHFEDRFELNIPVVLIDREEICQILQGVNWNNFRGRYPHSGGLKEFSRVAFNVGKTQALVYVGNTSDSLIGIGQFFLLGKDGEKWTVLGQHTTWVS
ncbi:MAG TPA: hypothetical protein PKH77_02850 [Anaerolineae bacterium]|nr:hypothetical protein [Anaerolineae bacterium]